MKTFVKTSYSFSAENFGRWDGDLLKVDKFMAAPMWRKWELLLKDKYIRYLYHHKGQPVVFPPKCWNFRVAFLKYTTKRSSKACNQLNYNMLCVGK